MATIIKLAQIRELLKGIDVVAAMEHGFVQYSEGNAVVPPVGELILDEAPGEVHIKYGYIRNDDFYVIKIASGFYENPKLNLPSGNGLMLAFSQRTGQLEAILLDEGHLTDMRTAAAGAVTAKYFAPKELTGVGIIGTGVQARLQLSMLQQVRNFENVWVWGRNQDSVSQYKEEHQEKFNIQIAETPAQLAHHCNLIVTTTPSKEPLLYAKDIQPGTHITAVGSDTEDKQELHEEVLKKADIVVSDSIPQSQSRGEIFQARKSGVLKSEDVIELGNAITNSSLHRSDNAQITVADLTGVAVQDIMITDVVYHRYKENQA